MMLLLLNRRTTVGVISTVTFYERDKVTVKIRNNKIESRNSVNWITQSHLNFKHSKRWQSKSISDLIYSD